METYFCKMIRDAVWVFFFISELFPSKIYRSTMGRWKGKEYTRERESRQSMRRRERKDTKVKQMGKWTGNRFTQSRGWGRNVSAAIRWCILIGWKKLKRKSHVWECGIEKRKRKCCTLDATMWRRSKITASILGELSKGEQLLPRSYKDGNREQAHAKATTENEKDSIKVCVCSLSSLDILFLFLKLKQWTRFSYSVSLFSCIS